MNRNITIFAGRSIPEFAKQMAKSITVNLSDLEIIQFSDRELSIDIGDNVRGRDVFVVQSTSTPGNDHLMELLIVIDALKRASAWRITAVMPYFGYARQDRKLRPRAPITAKLVADLLSTAGASRLLTTDLHSGQIMGFFNIPVDNLSALPVLLPHIKKHYKSDDLVIVSPDAGGVERARLYAQQLEGSNLAVIYKRRAADNKVAEMKVVGEVEGKVCLIIDDMIDTGGTLIKAGETLLAEGAKAVSACCVHAVLSGEAVENVINSDFKELVITDTIPLPESAKNSKIKVISMASFFGEALMRIHSDDSISSLFRP